MIYNSVYQMESGASTSAVFVIRTRGAANPMRLAAAAQNVIWSLDRGLPVLRFSTMHEVVSASLAIRRASLVLASGFALLALLLSLIGVYGVLSYSTAQRIPELGLRLALGATRGELIRMVLGEGLHLAACGIPLGLTGAALAGTLFTSLLFGVRALDPASCAAAVTMTIAASLGASYLPARRAARIDPLAALRYE
jgi:putative ABC transport system permease protein